MSAALRVLFADNHLLVVDKPAGLPVVPDASADASLLELAKEWVRQDKQKPGEVFLGVVHRLDRPVSGVVVFARTSKAASRLSEAFREHAVTKTYWGLGVGRARLERGVLEQWLLKDREHNRVRVVEPERGKRAVTRFEVRAFDAGVSWFEFEPVTGRSHQLRFAAAWLGTPLLGDLKYGAARPLSDKSIGLHARRLAFEHPVRREPVDFISELPALGVWDRLRSER